MYQFRAALSSTAGLRGPETMAIDRISSANNCKWELPDRGDCKAGLASATSPVSMS
jgi:hypothetical protein